MKHFIQLGNNMHRNLLSTVKLIPPSLVVDKSSCGSPAGFLQQQYQNIRIAAAIDKTGTIVITATVELLISPFLSSK